MDQRRENIRESSKYSEINKNENHVIPIAYGTYQESSAKGKIYSYNAYIKK